jgi:phenylacetate-coenzyme A ligase PaaK-like adenylate-forming protein
VRGVNLFPLAVDAAVRAVPGVREYQVEVDQRATLAEVRVRFEADDDARDPTPELAKHLRATFQLRIAVEKVAAGALPVFEMKAKRWKVLR